MSSPFVAEIRIFACNFAPTGWATCDGQLLPLSQNTALFSLLGTFYGGDGKSTFALPDLDGSAAMAKAKAPGFRTAFSARPGGEQFVTLLTVRNAEPRPFVHGAQSDRDRQARPAEMYLARSKGRNMYRPSGTNIVLMAPQAPTPTGGSLPHNNMSPYLTLVYCIALQGVFPPRP